MITLTIIERSKKSQISFNQSLVTIGNGPSPEIDVPLSLPQLQPVHVKIVEQAGTFYVYNAANDAYVTVNGKPFGKKKLKLHDIIYIYDIEIIIERLPQEPVSKDVDFILEDLLQDKIEAKKMFSTDPLEEEQLMSMSEIDALVQEVEEIEEATAGQEEDEEDSFEPVEEDFAPHPEKIARMQKEIPVTQIPTKLKTPSPDEKEVQSVTTIPKQLIATKYKYVTSDQDKQKKTPSPFLDILRAKMWWIILVCVILALMGIIIFFSYKNSLKQEREAARDVADVAMALLYAKQHPTQNKQQNWSEVSFLRDKINRLVHQSSEPLNIDAQGQFKNVPFILRLYTSKDRSRFLVVAQPTAAWFHWFIPIRAIVIDSNDMRLRVTTEIKALNVHLLRTASLEDTDEIESILERSPIIPLKSIGKGLRKGEFAPPDELASLEPDTIDYVYNAPRYFRMTEGVVAHAAKMVDKKQSQQDAAALMTQLVQLSSLPHLVFYTTEGIAVAAKAYSKLSSYHFGDSLHIGLITYNRENHQIIDTGLMVVKEKTHDLSLAGASALETESEAQEGTLSIWGMQMADLLHERRGALIPITNAIHELLSQNNQKPKEEFLQRYYRLIALYDQTDMEQQHKIVQSLQPILKEYLVKESGADIKKFLVEMTNAGLEAYIYSFTGKKETGMPNPLFDKIEKTVKLNELYRQAAVSAESLEHMLNDPNKKIHATNLLRLLVLQKSGALLEKSDIVVNPPLLPFEAR